jgi:hypothetical protein
MAFTVVYDDNAMYSNTPRDLLICIARAGLIRANGPKRYLSHGGARRSAEGVRR